MITVEELGDGLYVRDAEKNEVRIHADSFSMGGEPQPIGRFVDDAFRATARELRFPEEAVTIDSHSLDSWRTFASGVGPVKLVPGTHLIQIETNITIFILFTGTGDLHRTSPGGSVILNFPDLMEFTIGIRSRARIPRSTIHTSSRIRDMAAAVSHLSCALETISPERSYPTLRRHPPNIELDKKLTVPDDIIKSTPETGINFHISEDISDLFIVAPLVYYLGASITIDDGSPTLELTDVGRTYEFSSGHALQDEVSSLLHRFFYLDCLVREEGPYGATVEEMELLDELDLNTSEAYHASIQNRVNMYLDVLYEEIKFSLPEWTLSTYVTPSPEDITILPHLLDRLSLIQIASGSPVDDKQLIEESLSDFYRTRGRVGVDGNFITVGDRTGLYHNWVADGIPIDGWKMIPAAFENRFEYPSDNSPISITVVLNDSRMKNEYEEVLDIYRQRSEQLLIDIEIHQNISRDDLREVFCSSSDFLHFIGHCTAYGLHCHDQPVSISSLDNSEVQTFFLNACNSYTEGIELIKKGSIAGVVTLDRVLDNSAAVFGATFARLLINGFSIGRALELARRRILPTHQYLVLGDGTHQISQGDDVFPGTTLIGLSENGEYKIGLDVSPVRQVGGVYQPVFEENIHLSGKTVMKPITKSGILKFLQDANSPVLFDQEYYWSDEFYVDLSSSS